MVNDNMVKEKKWQQLPWWCWCGNGTNTEHSHHHNDVVASVRSILKKRGSLRSTSTTTQPRLKDRQTAASQTSIRRTHAHTIFLARCNYRGISPFALLLYSFYFLPSPARATHTHMYRTYIYIYTAIAALPIHVRYGSPQLLIIALFLFLQVSHLFSSF